jgi:hypothetical protein
MRLRWRWNFDNRGFHLSGNCPFPCSIAGLLLNFAKTKLDIKRVLARDPLAG